VSFTPGDIVGNYRVEAQVHRAAYSDRYRVRHVELETHHCLVVIKTPKLARRQLQAGRLHARLRHPNIVACTDLVRVGGEPALILDWINGALLREHLDARGELLVEEADGLASGLLRALDFMHRNGVIHRNIKPSGIALEPAEDRFLPRLTDLALARVFGTEDPTSGRLRRGLIGTASYMAPEQTRYPDAVDERADIWSVGVTLYQSLTGHLPFPGERVEDVIALVREGTYIPVQELRQDLPDRVVRTLAAALQVDPAHRLASARDFLRSWTGGKRRVATFKVPAAPSGTVTIVFTDVQDSTKLWDRSPDLMRKVLTAHDAIMRSTLARRAGYEVKTEGDAFMVAFSDATAAVNWCADVQLALAEHPWPEEVSEIMGTLRVRMGLHTGEPDCRPHPTTGAMDYFGPMVNRSARISGSAYGGQILASASVVTSLRSRRVQAVRLGQYMLKGISEPEELYDIRIPELPRTYPPPRATPVKAHASS